MTEKKKPAEIRMPARGVPIRTSHWNADERRAASTRIWQTRDRIVRTPACAWPARKKFWRSGFVMYPDPRSISADRRNEPPSWIVGTRMSVSPVISLVARLMGHRPFGGRWVSIRDIYLQDTSGRYTGTGEGGWLVFDDDGEQF